MFRYLAAFFARFRSSSEDWIRCRDCGRWINVNGKSVLYWDNEEGDSLWTGYCNRCMGRHIGEGVHPPVN